MAVAWARPVAMLIVFMATLSEAGFLLPKVHVHIVNQMNTNLNVHCKSKDNDIGLKVLHPNDLANPYHFKFRPEVMGTTLFFCSFQWGNAPLKHYDVFDDRTTTCRKRCFYSVQDANGICLMSHPPDGNYDLCFNWNNSTILDNPSVLPIN